jgi:glutamate/tyrosine decarboxylase-like PLP-dependent enzyme
VEVTRDEIGRRETAARHLEPSRQTRKEWLGEIAGFTDAFIDSLEVEPAFRGGTSPSLHHFRPDGPPADLGELLRDYQCNVLKHGLNPASGGHLGYIPGGGIFPSALGDYLAALTNQYAGVFFAGPGAVRMEHDLIRWMCRLIGYPETALGNLASGGSIANLIAVCTARDAMGISAEHVSRAVVYLTHHVHHCVHKALRIAGLSSCVVRAVPMDGRYRMDPKALAGFVAADRQSGLIPFMVVASAGTTDVGAVDPLNEIADVAESEKLWLHIDAAYGGFFILSDLASLAGGLVRDQFRGIERSDSVAIDPHKGLFLAYGVGAVLIKNVRALHDTHHYRATYLQDALSAVDELNPADLSPELTKHFRGLRMWLPLRMYGLAPFVAALEEKILLCRYFYQQVQRLGFKVGPYPDLSVCTYRFVPKEGEANDFNLKLVEAVHRDGHVFISSTSIDGVVWLRLAVLCFRTHLAQIDHLLSVLAKATSNA